MHVFEGRLGIEDRESLLESLHAIDPVVDFVFREADQVRFRRAEVTGVKRGEREGKGDGFEAEFGESFRQAIKIREKAVECDRGRGADACGLEDRKMFFDLSGDALKSPVFLVNGEVLRIDGNDHSREFRVAEFFDRTL